MYTFLLGLDQATAGRHWQDLPCTQELRLLSWQGQFVRDQQLNDTCQLMNRGWLPPA